MRQGWDVVWRRDDFETMVISAGTSGTINRVCRANVPLAGNAACFEYYKNRLLLMMLADCCKWYDRFVAQFASEYCRSTGCVECRGGSGRFEWAATGPACGRQGSLSARLGATDRGPAGGQYSVFDHAGTAVADACHVSRNDGQFDARLGIRPDWWIKSIAVLSAGVSRGRQNAGAAGQDEDQRQKGPLRYQTAAYGALLNAMRTEKSNAAKKLCPTQSAARPDTETKRQLEYLLRAFGL